MFIRVSGASLSPIPAHDNRNGMYSIKGQGYLYRAPGMATEHVL
jgi:hypothetical protein